MGKRDKRRKNRKKKGRGPESAPGSPVVKKTPDASAPATTPDPTPAAQTPDPAAVVPSTPKPAATTPTPAAVTGAPVTPPTKPTTPAKATPAKAAATAPKKAASTGTGSPTPSSGSAKPSKYAKARGTKAPQVRGRGRSGTAKGPARSGGSSSSARGASTPPGGSTPGRSSTPGRPKTPGRPTTPTPRGPKTFANPESLTPAEIREGDTITGARLRRVAGSKAQYEFTVGKKKNKQQISFISNGRYFTNEQLRQPLDVRISHVGAVTRAVPVADYDAFTQTPSGGRSARERFDKVMAESWEYSVGDEVVVPDTAEVKLVAEDGELAVYNIALPNDPSNPTDGRLIQARAFWKLNPKEKNWSPELSITRAESGSEQYEAFVKWQEELVTNTAAQLAVLNQWANVLATVGRQIDAATKTIHSTEQDRLESFRANLEDTVAGILEATTWMERLMSDSAGQKTDASTLQQFADNAATFTTHVQDLQADIVQIASYLPQSIEWPDSDLPSRTTDYTSVKASGLLAVRALGARLAVPEAGTMTDKRLAAIARGFRIPAREVGATAIEKAAQGGSHYQQLLRLVESSFGARPSRLTMRVIGDPSISATPGPDATPRMQPLQLTDVTGRSITLSPDEVLDGFYAYQNVSGDDVISFDSSERRLLRQRTLIALRAELQKSDPDAGLIAELRTEIYDLEKVEVERSEIDRILNACELVDDTEKQQEDAALQFFRMADLPALIQWMNNAPVEDLEWDAHATADENTAAARQAHLKNKIDLARREKTRDLMQALEDMAVDRIRHYLAMHVDQTLNDADYSISSAASQDITLAHAKEWGFVVDHDALSRSIRVELTGDDSADQAALSSLMDYVADVQKVAEGAEGKLDYDEAAVRNQLVGQSGSIADILLLESELKRDLSSAAPDSFVVEEVDGLVPGQPLLVLAFGDERVSVTNAQYKNLQRLGALVVESGPRDYGVGATETDYATAFAAIEARGGQAIAPALTPGEIVVLRGAEQDDLLPDIELCLGRVYAKQPSGERMVVLHYNDAFNEDTGAPTPEVTRGGRVVSGSVEVPIEDFHAWLTAAGDSTPRLERTHNQEWYAERARTQPVDFNHFFSAYGLERAKITAGEDGSVRILITSVPAHLQGVLEPGTILRCRTVDEDGRPQQKGMALEAVREDSRGIIVQENIDIALPFLAQLLQDGQAEQAPELPEEPSINRLLLWLEATNQTPGGKRPLEALAGEFVMHDRQGNRLLVQSVEPNGMINFRGASAAGIRRYQIADLLALLDKPGSFKDKYPRKVVGEATPPVQIVDPSRLSLNVAGAGTPPPPPGPAPFPDGGTVVVDSGDQAQADPQDPGLPPVELPSDGTLLESFERLTADDVEGIRRLVQSESKLFGTPGKANLRAAVEQLDELVGQWDMVDEIVAAHGEFVRLRAALDTDAYDMRFQPLANREAAIGDRLRETMNDLTGNDGGSGVRALMTNTYGASAVSQSIRDIARFELPELVDGYGQLLSDMRDAQVLSAGAYDARPDGTVNTAPLFPPDTTMFDSAPSIAVPPWEQEASQESRVDAPDMDRLETLRRERYIASHPTPDSVRPELDRLLENKLFNSTRGFTEDWFRSLQGQASELMEGLLDQGVVPADFSRPTNGAISFLASVLDNGNVLVQFDRDTSGRDWYAGNREVQLSPREFMLQIARGAYEIGGQPNRLDANRFSLEPNAGQLDERWWNTLSDDVQNALLRDGLTPDVLTNGLTLPEQPGTSVKVELREGSDWYGLRYVVVLNDTTILPEDMGLRLDTTYPKEMLDSLGVYTASEMQDPDAKERILGDRVQRLFGSLWRSVEDSDTRSAVYDHLIELPNEDRNMVFRTMRRLGPYTMERQIGISTGDRPGTFPLLEGEPVAARAAMAPDGTVTVESEPAPSFGGLFRRSRRDRMSFAEYVTRLDLWEEITDPDPEDSGSDDSYADI